ncbi:MAG: AMP-binding protein, partial [Bacteroidaceae bacterium]
MVERFLKQATFSSLEDFQKNFEFKVPADFNFACDVVDGWAEQAPDKLAMLWTNDKDEEIRYTFGQLKEESDRTASFFQSLGIGKGDMVMLILKRHPHFWPSMLPLNKIGAIAIPATF